MCLRTTMPVSLLLSSIRRCRPRLVFGDGQSESGQGNSRLPESPAVLEEWGASRK